MLPAMSANLEKLNIKDMHTNAVFEMTINITWTKIVLKISIRLEYNKMFNLLIDIQFNASYKHFIYYGIPSASAGSSRLSYTPANIGIAMTM